MQLDEKLLFNSIYSAVLKQDDLCPDLINAQKTLDVKRACSLKDELLKIITGIHKININKWKLYFLICIDAGY